MFTKLYKQVVYFLDGFEQSYNLLDSNNLVQLTNPLI